MMHRVAVGGAVHNQACAAHTYLELQTTVFRPLLPIDCNIGTAAYSGLSYIPAWSQTQTQIMSHIRPLFWFAVFQLPGGSPFLQASPPEGAKRRRLGQSRKNALIRRIRPLMSLPATKCF